MAAESHSCHKAAKETNICPLFESNGDGTAIGGVYITTLPRLQLLFIVQ
jgi:hypothetical protein